MTIVYRSKSDAWLVAILTVAIIVSLFTAFTALSADAQAGWGIAALTAIIGAGLPLWLLFSTRYTLGHNYLVVQSGPFMWRILLADIKSITPSLAPFQAWPSR